MKNRIMMLLGLTLSLAAGAHADNAEGIIKEQTLKLSIPKVFAYDDTQGAIKEVRVPDAAAKPMVVLAQESGYQFCRESGIGHSSCLKAAAGYQYCRESGIGHSSCVEAGEGYKYCRQSGIGHASCVEAGAGYQYCRESGIGHSSCLNVK